MTLATHVYVLDPIPPSEVLDKCRELLGATARVPIQEREGYEGDGSRILGHPIGQGLPALLSIQHRSGAPLRTVESIKAHGRWCEPDCDGSDHDGHPCFLDVDFDTSYGYQDDHGGCGELHARLVAQLGQWLDAQGIRWEWRNEYTGDVHGGDARYERLLDLCERSKQARDWFQNVVMPAVLRDALR